MYKYSDLIFPSYMNKNARFMVLAGFSLNGPVNTPFLIKDDVDPYDVLGESRITENYLIAKDNGITPLILRLNGSHGETTIIHEGLGKPILYFTTLEANDESNNITIHMFSTHMIIKGLYSEQIYYFNDYKNVRELANDIQVELYLGKGEVDVSVVEDLPLENMCIEETHYIFEGADDGYNYVPLYDEEINTEDKTSLQIELIKNILLDEDENETFVTGILGSYIVDTLLFTDIPYEYAPEELTKVLGKYAEEKTKEQKIFCSVVLGSFSFNKHQPSLSGADGATDEDYDSVIDFEEPDEEVDESPGDPPIEEDPPIVNPPDELPNEEESQDPVVFMEILDEGDLPPDETLPDEEDDEGYYYEDDDYYGDENPAQTHKNEVSMMLEKAPNTLVHQDYLKHIEVVIGIQEHPSAGFTWMPCAASYAAMRYNLPYEISATNKEINSVSGLYSNDFSKKEVAILSESGYICIVTSIKNNFVPYSSRNAHSKSSLFSKPQYLRTIYKDTRIISGFFENAIGSNFPYKTLQGVLSQVDNFVKELSKNHIFYKEVTVEVVEFDEDNLTLSVNFDVFCEIERVRTSFSYKNNEEVIVTWD